MPRPVHPRLTVLALAAAAGMLHPATVASQRPASGARTDLDQVAQRFRVEAISTRRFTHTQLWQAITPFLTAPGIEAMEIGQSIQGRGIRAIRFGEGTTTVLLWSQMHGDESTATMALADILRFLATGGDHPLRERLRRDLSVVFVPMLNPDGAELFQRQNAAGIDVNRDARVLATPEGRALKALHERLRPAFGFNLHDQNARTRAGPTGLPVAIALLAPAFDEARSYNAVRRRAREVAGAIAGLLAEALPGRLARYDDTFNPRAFGDLVQQWGTSTVLIESGALPDDPEKQRLRALNVVAILGALEAIAGSTHTAADAERYEALPRNAGGAFDLLIRGGRLVLPGNPPAVIPADIAVNYLDPVARTGGRVRDVGDLSAVVALDTLDAGGLFLHPAPAALTTRDGRAWLTLDAPALLYLRRGPEADSDLVRRLSRE